MTDEEPMTEFRRWLEDRQMTPRAFAQEYGLNEIQIYQLARPGCYPSRPIVRLPIQSLREISEITGIPAGLLVDDLLSNDTRER